MCRQQKCWLDKNSSGSSSSSCSQAFQPHKLVLFLRGWSRMGAFGFPPISSTVMRKQTADQQKMEQKFMQWTTNRAPKKTEFDLCSLFLVEGGGFPSLDLRFTYLKLFPESLFGFLRIIRYFVELSYPVLDVGCVYPCRVKGLRDERRKHNEAKEATLD